MLYGECAYVLEQSETLPTFVLPVITNLLWISRVRVQTHSQKTAYTDREYKNIVQGHDPGVETLRRTLTTP